MNYHLLLCSALPRAQPSALFRVKKVDFIELSEVQKCKSPLENFHRVLNLNSVQGSKELKKDAGELFWPLAQSLQLHYS